MRRLCAVLSVLLICLLSACSSTETLCVTDFGSKVTIEYGATVLEGELRCCPQAETTLVLTDPPEVKGVSFCWNGERLMTKLSGETFWLEKAPRLSLPILIHAVFSDIDVRNGASQGVVDGYGYQCDFDKQSGFPVSLMINDLPLAVKFYQQWDRSTTQPTK